MAARIDLDVDELRRLLVDERRSFAEVARLLGVSSWTVGRRAREVGIVSQHRRVRREVLHDAEQLRARFDAGRTVAELADELGVHYHTVVAARRRFGIGASRAPWRAVDVEDVRRRVEAGQSPREIGRALGHDTFVITRAMQRLGLPLRRVVPVPAGSVAKE